MNRTLVAVGAIGMAIGIALGAFGAHALEGSLDAEKTGWYETGVRYLVWNALGLLALGAMQTKFKLTAWLIVAGTIIFTGSLLGLAFGLPRFLGAVAPIGGAGMILGWLFAAITILQSRNREHSE